MELIKNDVPLSSEEDEKADFINSLVHQDASQYFFFDGEKINDYSTASGSQYKDAIARVLGIKEVDNAVEDLGLLKKEFEKNRDAWIQTQNKYQDILQQKMEPTRKSLSRKPCCANMSRRSTLPTSRYKRTKIS